VAIQTPAMSSLFEALPDVFLTVCWGFYLAETTIYASQIDTQLQVTFAEQFTENCDVRQAVSASYRR
jgi:hypothetical protein